MGKNKTKKLIQGKMSGKNAFKEDGKEKQHAEGKVLLRSLKI